MTYKNTTKHLMFFLKKKTGCDAIFIISHIVSTSLIWNNVVLSSQSYTFPQMVVPNPCNLDMQHGTVLWPCLIGMMQIYSS